ncbi:hypothetical protein QQ045_016805 [Rhodiola kirilowii]
MSEAPTKGYESSKASIEWSKMTVEGFDRASPLRFVALLCLYGKSENRSGHPMQHEPTSFQQNVKLAFNNHDSSISGGLFHSPNPVAGTIMNTAPNSFEKNVMDMDMVPASVAAVSKKKSDKRSKIRTAQGLRDRRVRMSIGIARKFFDLQDLLGFDKPSRTLEWLLKSSNKAILELSAASSSSISSKETAADATRTGDGYKSLSSSRSTDEAERLSCNSAALQTMKQKATSLARESRDKARARARARTVAKLSTAKLNHQKIQLLSTYPDERRGDQNSYLSKNEYNFSSSSLVKSLVAESHNEERNNGDEQHKQNQKLQLHTYYSGNKSYYQSDLNPNLSLNQWDISSVFPQPSSSTAHHLNFPRDFDTFGRASWDCLLNNYKTL